MKTRQGFVSNSSSSSFVLIGFAVPNNMFNELDDARQKELYDDYATLDDCEGGAPSGHHLVGRIVAESDDYEPDASDLSFEEMNEIADEMKKVATDFFDDEFKIKMYTGTRMC